MKVADYVINFYADRGIDKIFVVYGAANGDLIDAFTRNDETEYVAVKHEQAGGFAAEAYAKIKGLPGVAIATSGPGGMNFVTPIGNCFYDSVPCIFLTGQINSRFLRPDNSIRQVGFQETDIVEIVKSITKYAKMITDPRSIRYELEKSFYLATNGRPGPVLLDIPLNIQKEDIDPDTLFGYEKSNSNECYDENYIDRKIDLLVDDLRSSKRPIMLVGGGVRISKAVDEVRELINQLCIPACPSWNALDVVTSDMEYYGGRVGTYGGDGRNFAIQNCDLLLCIGCRISGRITGGNLETFARGAKKYVVDVDETLVEPYLQQVAIDENILSDAKYFINRLLLKTRNTQYDYNWWTKRVFEWRDKYDPVAPDFYKESDFTHPYVFMRKLSERMNSNGILVGDCGGNIVISNHAFRTKEGQRNITNNGNSPMGFSHAASMGAWLANEDAQVVCTIGDGGFNMNIQELQTFLDYNIKVKTFIINNRIYGITKAFQKTNFGGRAEACGPKGYNPPDFIKVVEAYGIKTFSIKNNDEIDEVIDRVLEYDGPVVCDVECLEYHKYEPRIFGWKTPIEDMYPYISRDEFRQNMIIDPVEGWLEPEMPDIVE